MKNFTATIFTLLLIGHSVLAINTKFLLRVLPANNNELVFYTNYNDCPGLRPTMSYQFNVSSDTLYVNSFCLLEGIVYSAMFCTIFDTCSIPPNLNGINYITAISNFVGLRPNSQMIYDTFYHFDDSTFVLRTTAVNNTTALDREIKIWPNPVKNTLSISTKAMDKIQYIKIYNALGILVKEGAVKPDVQGKIEVDVTALPPGIYFVRLKGLKIECGQTIRFQKK